MKHPPDRKCRVVAVILRDDHVLLHRPNIDDFWSLPGGACRRHETTVDAMKREMSEEMGVSPRIGRLIWVNENMFEMDGDSFDEIELYFEVTLPPEYYDFSRIYRGVEGRLPLQFRWFRIEDIGSMTVYPEFLREGLGRVPTGIQHVVHNRPREPGDAGGALLT